MIKKKKKTGSGISINEQLVEKLHKSVIKKFKTRKVCARFKDNNWVADLDQIGSLSSKNIYYVSEIFSLNLHGLNL